MNETNTGETQADAAHEAAATETTPTRKRVAKKVAVKTAAKSATKKIAAPSATAEKTATKKVAAKKTTTKKVAAESSPAVTVVVETRPAPFIEITTPLDVEAAPKKKVVRARKVAKTMDSPPDVPSATESSPRFGRVPGGGPTQTREPQPATAAETEPADRPAPQARHDANAQPPQGQQGNVTDGTSQESRSKRRREKRKRRKQQGPPDQRHPNQQEQRHPNQQEQRHPSQQYQAKPHNHPHSHSHGGIKPQRYEQPIHEPRPPQFSGPKIETNGMLELAPKGFGFLRVPTKGFEQARDDVFVTPETIRKYNLRVGQWIHGIYQEGQRGPQLVEITTINGMLPEQASKLPHFEELKAINPTRRISFETTPERFTTRVVDIMAPVGRGQRGLIVSPPRSGKTTLLLHMAEAIREKYDEAIHLMVLLVDERPEEVTEFRRALPGAEIYASSNDEQPRNHCRIAELAIERAKRLVEAGQDVFLLMDSITRLARAYNNNMSNTRGRGIGSGGITIGALEVPRRLFAAARNTRGGGSLTIMATALIQTNSRADEAIFMEFKGTGNMELILDRKIAENYIYPAVDIFKSGTRREEILIPDHMLHKIHLIRRGLSGHRPVEAMERLLFFLKKFPNNPQMLLEIKG